MLVKINSIVIEQKNRTTERAGEIQEPVWKRWVPPSKSFASNGPAYTAPEQKFQNRNNRSARPAINAKSLAP